MSKKQFKSQASSSRAGAFGGPGGFGGAFGSSNSPGHTSLLSYVSEPPDLSQIPDANVVVAFKNLLKKDSTTKAKALDDLQSYAGSLQKQDTNVEDGVLEAWVGVEPHARWVESLRSS